MNGSQGQAKEPKEILLRLFVAGSTQLSARTIQNLQNFCRDHIAGRFELEIVDIFQQPHLAELNQVVAAPTLLRLRPLPVRRIIGDLSNMARVLRGLDVFSPDSGQQ